MPILDPTFYYTYQGFILDVSKEIDVNTAHLHYILVMYKFWLKKKTIRPSGKCFYSEVFKSLLPYITVTVFFNHNIGLYDH